MNEIYTVIWKLIKNLLIYSFPLSDLKLVILYEVVLMKKFMKFDKKYWEHPIYV